MERKSIGKNILNFNEQIEMIEAKRKKEKGTNQLGKNILVLFIKLEEAMMPLLVVLLLRGLRTRTRARCWNFKRGMRASATHTCRRRYTDMQTHTQRTRHNTTMHHAKQHYPRILSYREHATRINTTRSTNAKHNEEISYTISHPPRNTHARELAWSVAHNAYVPSQSSIGRAAN